MDEILQKIVKKRKEVIKQKGINFGINIPDKRIVPLVIPDFKKGVIITEIKRGSPSEGKMNNIESPVDWAASYIEGKTDVISILTEENFFFGSLKDLIEIKKTFPKFSVLRKDFLLTEDEVDISYRSGADLILLITGILDIDNLKRMKEKAEKLGMLPLIEVHNEDELKSILPLNPKLIGINSRDLKTFTIDRNYPIALKELIPDTTFVVFESGIRNFTDAFFAGVNGFSSVLVGTSIVKSGNLTTKVNEIKNGFTKGIDYKNNFYNKFFKIYYFEKRPVVKICGITNVEDAKISIENGADIIGFIFAESPRNISFVEARNISKKLANNILKVGVVVNDQIEEVVKLLKEGIIDIIQFHGDMNNEQCMDYGVNWYKALRVKDESDFELKYYSPIILYDAFSKESYGGTGKQIDKKLLDYAKEKNIKLCLAGGINAENVVEILTNYKPLMIDISSGIEKSPGKKDQEKIIKLFEKIKSVKYD